MYRSGFGSKPGQERVLGIDILRSGFERALENAILSSYDRHHHGSIEEWRCRLSATPARIQWDPERDNGLQKLKNVRTIQVGLSGTLIHEYVNNWTVNIEDVTKIAHWAKQAQSGCGDLPQTPSQLETLYPISDELARQIIPCIIAT